jgi:hypothetical protein
MFSIIPAQIYSGAFKLYRNIVILLDDQPARFNVLKVAMNMAKSSNGQITSVYVVPFSSTMFFMLDTIDVESIH